MHDASIYRLWRVPTSQPNIRANGISQTSACVFTRTQRRSSTGCDIWTKAPYAHFHQHLCLSCSTLREDHGLAGEGVFTTLCSLCSGVPKRQLPPALPQSSPKHRTSSNVQHC
eukprot:3851670-Amphidinium_carterae.1